MTVNWMNWSWMAWLLGQLTPQQPGLWLLISFLLGALHLASGRWLGQTLHSRLGLARWVLVPYLGLIFGGLSPRLLGLSELDWVAGFGVGVGLIFAAWVLLILVRVAMGMDGTPPRPAELDSSLGLMALVTAGAQQFHWSFLRGAVWALLLALPNPPPLANYWAIWLASGLALPGIFVHAQHNAQRLTTGVILVVTAILFFYTRNFWLCWLLHATTQALIGQPGATANNAGHRATRSMQ